MWSGSEEASSWREFTTPPAAWRKPPHPQLAAAAMTMPETRRTERPRAYSGVGGCRRDTFHAIHKVPSGDSPYVKAKHVQLIEKDPSKAVSLFWAAINAGDRVDSALKDMAVVMKQLNRPDEAVEAIKSFRHLCPDDSQDSLDNILVELYKKSGRMEDEIEMLQEKLRNMEEGIGLGGKRAKVSRSQGKKIHLTVEQEKSRILGNLAWAYLQQHNYGLAEQHYRKAVSLEPDKNKKCNLAICLMHMNRIPEAKSLLQEVRWASAESVPMDESYAKSFERACQLLADLESTSAVTTKPDKCTPAVLYTQPRRDSMNSNEGNQRRVVKRPATSMLSQAIRNLSGELDLTDENSGAIAQNSVCNLPSPKGRGQGCLWRDIVQPDSRQTRSKRYGQIDGSWRTPSMEDRYNVVEKAEVFEATIDVRLENGAENSIGTNSSSKHGIKSWADIVEEEEQELSSRNELNLHNYYEQGSDAENLDSNITLSLQAFSLTDGYDTTKADMLSRNQTARRSLCFGGEEEKSTMKRGRLQVFRDITPTPDSPQASVKI